MKNTIICSFLLSITLFKSYSQLQPDGTGTVNGYKIGPNVILGSSKPKSLSAGYYHNLAIRQDGSIIAKGWNAYSQSSIPRNISAVTSVAGGYFHSLALTKEGTIVTWGRNNYKQRCPRIASRGHTPRQPKASPTSPPSSSPTDPPCETRRPRRG